MDMETIFDALVQSSKGKHYNGFDTLTDIKSEFECTTDDILKVISDNGKTIADFKITEDEIRKCKVDDNTFKFEKNVIDPLLNAISEHQVYLSKRANLPQLAKLGYIYETLFSAGRICWGHKGRLSKSETSYDCEENPKYKIEMINPKNERIENLIYDAWSLHVRESFDHQSINFESFKKLILEGRLHEITELEKKQLKINKTFDEWVEILTNPQHRYYSLYKTRKRVLDHLLCTIGTGYGLNKAGYVIEELGADQDKSLYGDWQNAKFSPEIQIVVDKILSIPEVKLTVDEYGSEMNKIIQKEKSKENKQFDMIKDAMKRIYGDTLPKDSRFGEKSIDDLTTDELHDVMDAFIQLKFNEEKNKKPSGSKFTKIDPDYHPYYPICDYSIIDIMINKDSLKRERIKSVHQSYIDAGIEICKDILAHEEEEMASEYSKGSNVKFAKKFLAIVTKDGRYKDFIPEEIDKDKLFRAVKKEFTIFKKSTDVSCTFDFSDKRKNEYASDKITVSIKFVTPQPDLPMGFGNSVDYLINSPIYSRFKTHGYNLTSIEGIKYISFFYEKTPDNTEIVFQLHLDEEYIKYEEDKRESEKEFIKNGFMIGQHEQALILDGTGLMLLTHKSDTLGSEHPDNTNGKEYFSNGCKSFSVCQLTMDSWVPILQYEIDERHFNTFSFKGGSGAKNHPDIHKWVIAEFAKMKSSDPAYGTYGDKNRNRECEGKKCLYAFEFMKWLHKNDFMNWKLGNG